MDKKTKIKEKVNSKKNVSNDRGSFFARVGLSDKILFAKHLAVMLEAGIPLRDALEVLKEQVLNKSLRHILGIVIKDLSGGQVLAFSLAKFPRVFDPFFVNVIEVGEASGTLPASLNYLAAQLEKTQDLRGKTRNALIYPFIVFIGAIGIGIYLGFFMLPQLVPLFASLNAELPLTTRVLLFITTWLRSSWMEFLVALVFLILISFVVARIRAVKFATSFLVIRIPILGRLFREIQLMQFSRIFGILLKSGIKIVPALQITADSLTNLVYKKQIEQVAKLVERGGTVGEELGKHRRLFSKTSATMVAVGERTGHLPESLLSLADFSEREIDSMTKNLSTLIEPFVLIFVGFLVGFVALSIITPIYQLTQSFSR